MTARETKVTNAEQSRSSIPRDDATDPCLPKRHVTRQATWALMESRVDAVVGASAPDWFNLESHRGARRVKIGHYRSVWRIKTPDGTFFCKVFDRNPEQSRFIRALVPHPAVREWRLALAARLRGVPAVEVVALGIGRSSRLEARRRSNSGRIVLITEAFEPGEPLSATFEKSSSRHTIIQAVADLYAVAHRRGFVHRDGHPGNVLVREQHGRIEARFLDVHSAGLYTSPVPKRAAARALGQLDHYSEVAAIAHRMGAVSGALDSSRPVQPGTTRPFCSNTERLRFLRSYLDSRSSHEGNDSRSRRWLLKRWARAIRYEGRRQAARLAWQRDRRLRRSGRYFARIDLGGGWRGTVVLAQGRRHVFPAVDMPDFTIDQWRHAFTTCLSSLSKSTRPIETNTRGHADFTRVAECRIGDTRAVMFLQHPVRNPIRAALIGSRARRIFEHTHRLRHRDIAAPLALGYLEHSSMGMITSCALVVPDRTPV